MSKLYIRQKEIISQDTIDFLVEESKSTPFRRSTVTGPNPVSDYRTSKQIDFHLLDLPDVVESITNLAFQFDVCDNWEDIKNRETINLLLYEKGGKFGRHSDVVKAKNNRLRYFSSSILIAKSSDLVGGDLILYSDDDVPFKVDLEVGEAVLFHSKRYHEVTEVEQGWRLALIVWLSK